jgi:hypothetical protein
VSDAGPREVSHYGFAGPVRCTTEDCPCLAVVRSEEHDGKAIRHECRSCHAVWYVWPYGGAPPEDWP